MIFIYLFRRIKNKILGEEELVSSFKIALIDYIRRIENIERVLMDLNVRLDILEVKPNLKNDNKNSDIILKNSISHLTRNINHNIKLNKTENEIINIINNGINKVREIQIRLNKSREHTSRLLKILYEKGYIIRKGKNKSYYYELSEKAKRVVIK
jgi:DNA-binding transcriptional ArsR family regulator